MGNHIIKQKDVDTIIKLYNKGDSVYKISSITGFTTENVRRIVKSRLGQYTDVHSDFMKIKLENEKIKARDQMMNLDIGKHSVSRKKVSKRYVEDKKSIDEIAAEFKVKRSTVISWLKTENVDIEKREYIKDKELFKVSRPEGVDIEKREYIKDKELFKVSRPEGVDTVGDIRRFANRLAIGSKCYVYISKNDRRYHNDFTNDYSNNTKIAKVTILEKYPHICKTDKGYFQYSDLYRTCKVMRTTEYYKATIVPSTVDI